MNTKRIMNVAASPVEGTDAASKKYVDDLVVSNAPNIDLSGYLKLDGSIAMIGELNMDRRKITNVATPVDVDDAENKSYVDSKITSVGDVNLDMKGKKITNLISPKKRCSDQGICRSNAIP